jgi:multidrug efflux pump subunit AcrB
MILLQKLNILVKLIPTKERKKSDKLIMAEIRSEVKNIAGAKLSFGVQGVGGGGEKPVTLSIRGADLSKLEEIAEKVEAIVKSTPGAVDVDNSLELSKPEIRINIDREKASDLAVNPLFDCFNNPCYG